ncbi:MAG: sigma 54-interacting transcriptional regulator [Deltaproteobacteria bacterium]|nr:sigma 54-interacting transcriptional regulator [Deltaproteobacteria bacterium]
MVQRPPSSAPSGLAILQRITLQMISSLDLDAVLSAVTEGLVEEMGAELTRIWLIGPGDLCDSCFKAPHCRERSRCLHLKSSSGLSERLNGTYRRVPLGAFKIGHIAETRQPTWARDVQNDPRIQDHAWAAQNGLQSFAGYPLVFRDELLGVLGMFSPHKLSDTDFAELEIFANHAAIAIKNAQLYKENAELTLRLEAENVYLKEEIHSEQHFGEIVGSSRPLTRTLNQVEQVAPTNATVLIQGETGTGKELIARAIHRLSPRENRPMIKVNCAAISAGLVESELFGHERGAFTGALERRIGRFELAHQGTLFLDEVGELPLESQVKLLRILQEQELERVGSSSPIRVDVRVIAATNRDLAEQVREGRFRSDLFYRLNVFPIQVPPLRNRDNDILLLVQHFLNKLSRQLGKPLHSVREESLGWMLRYSWPGNVRELRNVVERAAILAREPIVKIGEELGAESSENPVHQTLEAMERHHISTVLEQADWVIEGPRGAARILDMNPSTLRSRLRKLNLRKK